MRRWRAFAGLAKELEDEPFELLFANPFPFNADVYRRVEATVGKAGLASGHANLRFLHHANHPRVERDGPAVVPGWNATNAEATARGQHACYVLFDRDGRLVFHGKAAFEEMRARVRQLLRP